MTQEHTPTPWKVVEDDVIHEDIRKKYEIFKIVGSSEVVCGDDGICTVDRMNDRSFAEDAANMRHIVKCVNMHDELVEALERAIVYMKEEFNNIDDTGEEFSIVEQAEEAFKKAGAL